AGLLRCVSNSERHSVFQKCTVAVCFMGIGLRIGNANHGHVGDGIYEQTLASNSRGGAERAEHVPINVFFGVSNAEAGRKPGQAMAGSNNKVFTAVLNDKPAPFANSNYRTLGFHRFNPPLWV